jgi:hypothetical protein
MILQITIGESICVSVDDCIEDVRLTPEQTEDYLTRMRRTAIDLFEGIPDEQVPALVEEDES